MNLKFIDDITNMVKSILFNFSVIVGLHCITYGAYITYKHLTKKKYKDLKDKDIQMEKIENIETTEFKDEDSSLLEDSSNIESNALCKEDEELSRLKCINEYKKVLEKKQKVLSSLISQLDTISTDILKIKEKLENLNHINRQIT